MQADHIEQGYVPRIAGERLPATYINHYTANGGAVVPQFGFNASANDERALEDIYQAYNGERKVYTLAQYLPTHRVSLQPLILCLVARLDVL